MTLHIFPTALHPTPAQLAEARRILSVETRSAEDVARRPLARIRAWNALRAARLQARQPQHHPGPNRPDTAA